VTRVLVVDDDPQILRALRINLRAREYDVDVAADGASALRAAAAHPPDLVVLDLGLPDLDGAEVIRGLRGWSNVPIIVLSGRAEGADKVGALDAGADDYLTKPFGVDELLARIRAVTRRLHPQDAASPAVARIGRYTIDLSDHTISPADLRLTPTEWQLLERLLRKPRQADHPAAAAAGGVGPAVQHRDQLSAAVPGPAAPQARGRPDPAAASDHRTRHGLPLSAVTASS
jgi:two-component system KDP operon response regulator KdpE